MHRRRAGPLCLTLAVTAGVAGCGGDDGDVVLDVPESPSDGEEALHSPGLSAKPPLGLPVAGTYAYDVSGTSGLPAEATLVVEDVAEYKQKWILERPEPTGGASIETLDIVAQFDGLRLAARSLSQATGAGPLALEFKAPANPVMFIPHFKVPGGASTTELLSADGCYKLVTDISVPELNASVPIGTASYTAYFAQMVSTLSGLGKAGCRALEITTTEKVWLDRESWVPVKDQTTRQGKSEGVSLAADVTTDVRSTKPS